MRFPHGTISKVAAAFMLCTLVFVNLTAAQFKSTDEDSKSTKIETRAEIAPSPIFLSGNPSCRSIDPNFGELKLDFSSPNGSYPFAPGPGVVYSGGTAGLAPKPTLILNVSSTGTAMTQWSLSPLNQIDRLIYYIIVKGGPNANGYDYRPGGSIGDSGSFPTPNNGGFGVSHISFCFLPFSGPSSAPVSISGRVLTSTGDGIAYTRVDVVSLSTGEVYSAMTNNFGYYTVADLTAEETYMVTATHRRHTFINNQRTVTTSEDIFGVDFVAP